MNYDRSVIPDEFAELDRLLNDYVQAAGEVSKLPGPYDALTQNPAALVIFAAELEHRAMFIAQAGKCLTIIDGLGEPDAMAESLGRRYAEITGHFDEEYDTIRGKLP